MPSGAYGFQSAFMGGTGVPDTIAIPLSLPGTPGDFNNYAPGQLGMPNQLNDRIYEPVILDSGATSATPSGAPTAKQLLYWKDKAARIVTNDSRFAQFSSGVANAYRNMVSGVLMVTPGTPGAGGTLIFQLKKGRAISVKTNATTPGPGQIAIVDSSTTAAQALELAAGQAATYVSIGIGVGTGAGGNANIDVDIPLLG